MSDDATVMRLAEWLYATGGGEPGIHTDAGIEMARKILAVIHASTSDPPAATVTVLREWWEIHGDVRAFSDTDWITGTVQTWPTRIEVWCAARFLRSQPKDYRNVRVVHVTRTRKKRK